MIKGYYFLLNLKYKWMVCHHLYLNTKKRTGHLHLNNRRFDRMTKANTLVGLPSAIVIFLPFRSGFTQTHTHTHIHHHVSVQGNKTLPRKQKSQIMTTTGTNHWHIIYLSSPSPKLFFFRIYVLIMPWINFLITLGRLTFLKCFTVILP